MTKNIITAVEAGSICEELGVEKGDSLIEINGNIIKDVFDYRFYTADEYIEALIQKENGEQWLLEIEKDETEDLGIQFETAMMDNAASCENKCIFCFIDQLPKGLRKTLYFKDDDSRLSFLQGNYVTLTNMSDEDFDRLLYYKFSPINVSVHTSDGELRKKMLNNKNAGNIVDRLTRLSNAGIAINCQIVLVKGINDEVRLRSTLARLYEISGVRSVSVVPVGLTKFRDNLFNIAPFTADDAAEVINIVENMQHVAFKEKGLKFVYASDEFYIKAKKELPLFDDYDDFPQLENGVGMIRAFEQEFNEAYEKAAPSDAAIFAAVITGKSAYPFIVGFIKKLSEKFVNMNVKVVCVHNDFFGESVTVSGLLTGKDIIRAIKSEGITGRVLLPCSCLKAGTDLFIDGLTLLDINKHTSVNAVSVVVHGKAFIDALLGNAYTGGK